MKLNDNLIELAKQHITKVDKIRLYDLTSLDKMSSIVNALYGKRHLEPKDYDIFQKYILNKSNGS